MARVDPSVSCLASPVVSSYPSCFFLIVIGADGEERGEAVGSGGVLFSSCGEGVLFPHYDWLGGERGGDGDDAPFYPARFLIFTVLELMLATGIASMTRMREVETIGNDNGGNETEGLVVRRSSRYE